MKLPSFAFPHGKKIFSVFLFLILISFIAFNIHETRRVPRDLTLFTRTFDQPFSIQSHMQAAFTLWNKGFYKTAKNELLLASDLYADTKGRVLGVATAPAEILADWESQPQKLYGDYAFWIKVTAEKPEYRDGFIMAGIDAYRLGKREEAKSLLQKAYALDPNYTPLNALLEKMGK